MDASTVAKIMETHTANRLVQAPTITQLPANALDLSFDQPGGGLTEAIIDGAISALEQGQTHYVDVPGILPLREAVVADLGARSLTGYQPTNTVVTASMQEARFLSLQIIGQTLGQLALPSVVHPGVRKALGVRPLEVQWLQVEESRGLLSSPDTIESALQAGAQLLYLESPSRLTGASYGEADVGRIGQLASAHGATILWDQGLSGWTPDDASLAALGERAGQVTLLGDLLPGVGLEGLALGFIATDAENVAGLTSMKQIISICTSTASQYAGLQAAEGYGDRRTEIRRGLEARRPELVARLEALGAEVLPGQAASHVAVRASEALGAALHAGAVIAADGAGFGAPGILRLAVTADGSALTALEGGRA